MYLALSTNWEQTIFSSPTGNGIVIIATQSSSSLQGKGSLNHHFSVTFKTLSTGPAPGIEATTSRSAVKHPTDELILLRQILLHRLLR